MANHERFTAQQIIDAIKGSGDLKSSFGIKSEIAKRLNCSRWTVDNYIKRYATVRRAYEEERERPVDIAEVRHFEKVNEGHWAAVKYMLSTRGKDRGYVERREYQVEQQGPLPVIVYEAIKDESARQDNKEALTQPDSDSE